MNRSHQARPTPRSHQYHQSPRSRPTPQTPHPFRPFHPFRPGDDTGAASVSALAVALSVLLFALLGVTFATALHARHRAQSAADFAALAAAGRALEGQGEACARAAAIAGANGATVESCALEGLDAVVTVSVTPGFAPTAALGGAATAGARAGPVAPFTLNEEAP
ncbi:Rv3654c family TadE-like protein [Phytomonospora endophytica]|uniref:Secretion/DNA translocation related TadE-like protein n=1 Tax=Phytomonospora endophytica TaxID=714109 RepID=A0A841FNQ2_9ACTN|nr:Rv3654c family TadE-like protein [Phytomonospora endophytica]MBB6035428.1 secretion/DNA translocation related TadE-like protein [Phytomonospora endophytica]GIG63820.1 hypothetical protein Pen01_01150 [Phytomonospora endophytica]